MEVVDSHMTEHFSTLAPSHVDIDMSGEYYDEEYMMHDAAEATNDEEIYDAEIDRDEQPGHDEVEMDEYTDEVADDNETHMGTYVSGDDATVTDATVEDIQLRSSPVLSATPREVPLRPISPHVALDADPPINEAPTDTLAAHSPHSVATLVDDSETAQVDGAKEDPLNEVIDLTDVDDHPQALSGEVVAPTEPEYEVSHIESDPTEQEVYENDNLAVATGSPIIHTTAPDQSLEEEEEDAAVPTAGDTNDAADVPTHLEIPEQTDQDSHSPIEEALVINQQVRDDAADSMEPSPPVRLCYKDENKGIDKTFDIFASSGSASQNVELLFHDNRTLFYEPLSSFFLRLREADYFSSDDWQDSEMQLKMDLRDFDLSISEDHKDTGNISLFKLSFIWSGLGLEGPLCLRLKRCPERFTVQFARLIEQIEQGDLQNEVGEELHEVQHQEEYEREVDNEAESSRVDGKNTIEHGIEENEHGSDEGGEGGALGELHAAEENVRPHGEHEDEDEDEGEGEGEDAGPPEAELPKVPHEPHQETSTAHNDTQDPQGSESSTSSEYVEHDRGVAPEQANEETAPSPNAQDESADAVSHTDPRDNDEGLLSQDPSFSSDGEVFQGDEYNEYEIGEYDLAPQGADPNGTSASPWEHAEENEYDYYENYEDAEGEQTPENRPFTDNANNDSAGSGEAKPTQPTAQTEPHGSAPKLKRHIDDLEYEAYETPSAPGSPASDYKRVRHAQ